VSEPNRIPLDVQRQSRKVRAPVPRIKDLIPDDRLPTEQELEDLKRDCIRFCNTFPQVSYVTTRENWLPGGPIDQWCRENHALPTLENLTACLNDVPEQFRYDLSAAGISGYGVVDGSVVVNLPSKFYQQALDPHPTIQPPEDLEDRMSADEFREHDRKVHPEAWETGSSAFERESATKAVNTFLSFHKDYVPTAEAREFIEQYLETNKLFPSQPALEAAFAAAKEAGKVTLRAGAKIEAQVIRYEDQGGNKPLYAEAPASGSEGVDQPLTAEERSTFTRRQWELTSAEHNRELNRNPRYRKFCDGELS
jgi:hypothetical protein